MRYPLRNRAMAEKLHEGDALDVRREGEEVAPGYFILREFHEDVDYCDAAKEAWIWSIGRALVRVEILETIELVGGGGRSRPKVVAVVPPGAILASTLSDLYQNPKFVCLFLR